MTNKQELEAAQKVFKAVTDHINEGGSYRHLIYDRLGYGPDAYSPLYKNGGMAISNFINESHVILKAARDLIEHWDSPDWDYKKPPTAEKINALREAVNESGI